MSVPELSLNSLKCPYIRCNFDGASITILLSHLRLVHASDPNFLVSCGIDGCCKTLKTFSALYQHIYKKHKNTGIIKKRFIDSGESSNSSSSAVSSSLPEANYETQGMSYIATI